MLWKLTGRWQAGSTPNPMELSTPMAIRTFSLRHPGRIITLVLLICGLFAGNPVCAAPALAAEGAATMAPVSLEFLPLKIHAITKAADLAATADTLLQQMLTAKGVSMLPRSRAAALFSYDATWPPDRQEMSSYFAQHALRFLATGTLTQTGNAISVDLAVFDSKGEPATSYFFATADSTDGLEGVLQKLVEQIVTFADRTTRITKVTVRGNNRVDTGAILRGIVSSQGSPMDRKILSQDLKNIYKLGFFEDVQVEATATDDGTVLTFVVKEKALVSEVTIIGQDKIKEDDIKPVLTVQRHQIINTNEVNKSIQNIRQLYKEKGFYNTTVDAKLSEPAPGKVEVGFTIDEGKKIYVKEIRITGNNAYSSKEIKKVLEGVKEKGLFSFITDAGLLKLGMLEHDADRIASFYHNNGYIEAKVGKPEVVQEGEWLFVTFSISEGDRFKVGTVEVAGELIEETDILLNLVNIRNEKYLSRKIIRDDVQLLTDFYAEKGYAFAEIRPDITNDLEGKIVNLKFMVRKGALIYVNRINIKGNTDTRDKVIRRQLAIKEKELFNAREVKASIARIRRLGYFEDVTINPEPTLEKDQMDVNVEVKEKPTGTFSVGAGYSSSENLLFQGEISKDNLFGRGQKLSLQAKLSGTSSRYNLGFTEPAFLDTKLLTGVDLFNWKREYDDYTKDSNGFSFRFGYPLWRQWTLFWSYGYDATVLNDVRIDASQEILDSEGITNYVKLGVVRDTRDKGYDASSGARHSITLKNAGPPLGGDFAFSSLEAETSWYFPGDQVLGHKFFVDTTFHLNLSAGYVQKNSGGRLPVYEKFYLGGISTIRGFKSGKISPQDPITGERIGGDKMWYSNFEYIFPLVKDAGLKGVVFLDAGNVYAVDKDWDFGFVKGSTGLGVRWLSPMGPLRLEWGYNLKQARDEDQSNWDFSIGGSF